MAAYLNWLRWPMRPLIVFLVSISAPACAVTVQTLGAGDPLLRIDLRALSEPLASSNDVSVVFLDESTLAFAYYTHVESAANRDFWTFSLHLMTADVTRNAVKPKATVNLGVQETVTARLFVNTEGQLLMRNGTELSLLDSQLKLVKRRSLARASFVLAPQPDRKAIPVVQSEGSSTLARLIDTSTLDDIQVWTDTRHIEAVSGRHMASSDFADGKEHLFVRTQGDDWRMVGIPSEGNCLAPPAFVSDSVLVVSDCRGQVFWVDAGTAAWSQTPIGEDHRSLAFLLSTPGGRRFAATSVYWRFIWMPGEGSGRFTWRDGVQVYDVATRTLIFSRRMDSSWWFGPMFEGTVAISWTGTRLAIYNKGMLEVYHLP
jgi:hypothetical protein